MAMMKIKGPSVEEMGALLGEMRQELLSDTDVMKSMLVRHDPDDCPWCTFTEPLRQTEQWQDFVIECLGQVSPILVVVAGVDGNVTRGLHEVMATCLYLGVRLGRKQAIPMPEEADAS